MICPDCTTENRIVFTIFDAKYLGQVCPECQRIYSLLEPGGNRHYVDKQHAFAAMVKHSSRMGACNKALVDRIMRERD
jgi:hypothetical protein